MNFKLLTFIFVVIGVQSINSSIINKQSIDELVLTSNLDGEIINVNVGENPFAKIKSLTFNISDSVVQNGVRYPEVKCNNQGNDFCTRGNGKYQAKIVTCKNLLFGSGAYFQCELFNAKVINKNVKYSGAYTIGCLNGFTQETAKGMCRMEYSFASSASYNEADDVENKLFSAISKPSIDDLVQISNLDAEIINVNVGENPFAKIKSLTFNISDSVVQNGVRYPEVKCNNQGNNFCTRGNGKYQAKIVKCKNLLFGSGAYFQCELFNAKVINKNVKYSGAYTIACLNGFTPETAKGMCRMEYSYASSTSYNEADDVENKLFSAISKTTIDNIVQTGNFNVEAINLNANDNPWAKIKSFTFNISDSVVKNGVKYPEVLCNNIGNDFCSRGNGKYQAKIVTCENSDYGNEEKINHFECKLFGARKLNKNVKYSGSYGISCLSPFTPETAKGRCAVGYSFASSASYNEADDVDNEDEL